MLWDMDDIVKNYLVFYEREGCSFLGELEIISEYDILSVDDIV